MQVNVEFCSDCPAAESVADRMSGVPVVKGTRMPADDVVENYGSGSPVEEIAENLALNPCWLHRKQSSAGWTVEQAESWAWSSTREHLDLRLAEWLNLDGWSSNWNPEFWHVAPQDGLAEADLPSRMQEATHSKRQTLGQPSVPRGVPKPQRDASEEATARLKAEGSDPRNDSPSCLHDSVSHISGEQ